jgi:signal transduction histidine kinase
MTKTTWKALVIDDNRADAEILRRNLEKIEEFNVQVATLHTASDVEIHLSKHDYDCLMLDYRLGAVSGLDVLHTIRGSGNDVPVVFLTGFGNESIAVEAMKRGAQDYLAKDNVAPQVLQRSLSNAIHRVALERRVREKKKELEHFVSVVAHDLQQPLCAVRGNMELIRDFYAGSLDDTARGFVESAISMSGRMSAMIEALLAYSRVGRSAKALRTVDLNDCLETVTNALATVIGTSGGQVVFDNLPCVEGDEQALVQLVQNLVGTGLKFRGKANPVVSVSADREGDRWHIVVRDNGIGIDRKHHEEIFAPFKRLHSRAEFEGTGVGLATCKRIVDQHRGQIWLDSEPGRGSAFHFTLHAAKLPAENAAAEFEPECVLVVAEDGEIVFLLTEALRRKGCWALSADSLVEALDLLGRHPVSVVIADIPAGGRSAIEGIREIRALYPSIGVVAIAGRGEGQAAHALEAMRGAGVEHVFSKPLEIDELIRAASQLTASRQTNREPAASVPSR